jgi:microsomal dipeptidase-like Zn-dependent dipeptidase
MACRFGELDYNLTDDWIKQIAATGGVMGIILCDHYATNGIRGRTETRDQSVDVICSQIERIHAATGSYDHVAIGSDLDGFIKPTLTGLDDASYLAELERRLIARFGSQVASGICSGNALRVIQAYWR